MPCAGTVVSITYKGNLATVVFRLGKCIGARGPGPVFLIPFVDRPVVVDLRAIAPRTGRAHVPLQKLVFCEIHPPEHFPLLFYREPKAPDMNLTLADFDLEAVSQAKLLWITGTGLSEEPSRSTLLELIARRAPNPIALDLDFRPMFWPSRGQAARWIGQALEHVTIAVGNGEECEVAVGERDPRAAAAALLDRGVELAVVKRGAEGVLAATSDGLLEVAPIRLPVVNGLGAGDAFGGTLAHGFVHGWELERSLALANAAGALAASRLACADDFGRLEEIEALAEEDAHV